MRNALVVWLSLCWLSVSPVVLAQTVAVPHSAQQRVQMDTWPQSPEELGVVLQERAEQLQLETASVILFNGDNLYWEWHFSDIESDDIDSTTPRVAGRLAELFTALAVKQLIERGEWTLFDRVSQRLPGLDYENPYEERSPLLLIHLLEHASGFDQRRFKSHFLTSAKQPLDLVERLNGEHGALELRWPPGRMSQHSALNYAVLGAMLELHYRMPWSEVIEQQVIAPLGLEQTGTDIDQVSAALLTGHTGLPATAVDYRDRLLPAAEEIFSSAADLAYLGQYLLTRGASRQPAILRADTITSMERPRSTDASDAGLLYGMASGLDTRARYGHWLGVHSALHGHSVQLRYSPIYNLGYVVMTNHQSLLPALDELVWQHLVSQQPVVTGPPGGVNIEPRWQGWYRLSNPQHRILAPVQAVFDIAYLRRDGAELTLDPWFGPAVPLRSVDGSRLASREDGSIIGVLFSDEQGTQRLQVYHNVRQQVSPIRAWGPPLLVGLAMLILLSHPFARRDSLQHGWARHFTTLAMVCLVLSIFIAGRLTLEQASVYTWRSMLLTVTTTLFPLLAAAGLITTLRFWRVETDSVARWRTLAGALAASAIALWFVSAGWVALRTWAW